MNAAGFDKKRDKYWKEAALTLIILENVSVKKVEKETPHKKKETEVTQDTLRIYTIVEKLQSLSL